MLRGTLILQTTRIVQLYLGRFILKDRMLQIQRALRILLFQPKIRF